METACIFCDGKLEKYFIKKFEYWNVYLCEDQNYLGRTYIALNRHGPETIQELTNEEWIEFRDVIDKVSKVLHNLYKYDFINYLVFTLSKNLLNSSLSILNCPPILYAFILSALI